jgi:hypothetical protein
VGESRSRRLEDDLYLLGMNGAMTVTSEQLGSRSKGRSALRRQDAARECPKLKFGFALVD